MREIVRELNRLRDRSRFMLLLQRGSTVGAWVLGTALGLSLLDYVLRFPPFFRALLLAIGLAGLGWLLARRLVPAIGFRPTLTDLALRVERAAPGLSGRLASSVEFVAAGMTTTNPLAQRTVEETQQRLTGDPFAAAIDPRRTWRDASIAGVLLAIVAILTLVSPASAGTAAARLLWPFGGAEWPARTGVASMMQGVTVHPRGQALALRARGVKAPGDATEAMRLIARYRLVEADAPGPWREVVLRHQGDSIYEQLVDTDAQAIEFRFVAADSQTEPERIILSPPPAILAASLLVTPPAYAAAHVPQARLELGPGVDERGFTEAPLLAGSRAELRLTLNKPIPVESASDATWLRDTLGLPGDSPLPDLVVEDGERPVWVLRWTLERTLALNLHLVDEHGLSNFDEIAYRIDVATDREPGVAIIEPPSDQTVLPTAVVPVIVEGRDDVALSGVGLEMFRAGRTPEAPSHPLGEKWQAAQESMTRLEHRVDLAALQAGEGDVIEIIGAAEDVYERDGVRHDRARSAPRRLRVISQREFGEALLQELKALRQNAIRLEGQQAELQDDVIDEGVQPGVSRAQERISERLAEQLQALDQLRQRQQMNRFEDAALQSLVEQSRDLLEHAGRASAQAGAAIERRQRDHATQEQNRNQSQPNPSGEPTGERATTRGDRQQPGQQDQNPPPRQGEPRQAGQQQPGGQPQGGQQQQQAGEAEQNPQAGEPREQRGQPPEPELRQPDERDREIVERQQEVREELRDLIEALDRNEDTWVMNQRIRDLLQEQERLQTETQQLGNQTTGRSLDELEPEELSELDRIRQRQEGLAARMRDLIDDLRQRAEGLEQVDPAAAQAQRSAANTAEQRETDRTMEQASRQVRSNQLQNAQNSQQQVRNDLQQMLQDLDRKRARAEELQRRLESLVQSIERLVTVQESELGAVIRAKEGIDAAGRDRAMIRLSQNTQAVASEARAAGQEAARIARALDRAADAQAEAVTHLRAAPPAYDLAEGAETRSLDLLKEALALAKELEQQVEEDLVRQKREELLAGYRDLAERQVALRDQTLELQQQGELDRRALVEARRHANVQDEIRQALEAIKARTQEISDSPMFSHVHGLVDAAALQVIERLREGDVSIHVTDRQRSVAELIGRLVSALEEEMAPPNEFEEGNQGGEGGQGGGGGGQGQQQQPQPLVPPLAELKLLRGLQEQIYSETRTLNEASGLDDAARRQRLRDLSRQQQSLLELGQRLLEALQQQQGGPTPPGDPRTDGPTEGGAQ